MKYNYITIYNDFFTKQIPFSEFQKKMDEYIKEVNPGELTLFSNHITDDSFVEYDPDMVMLTYLHLWLFPNRLTQQCQICGADNMYLTFIKSILDSYSDDFKSPLKTIINNFSYQIYERGNIIIIFNVTETDITIPLPNEMRNKTYYCVNCGDELDFEKSIELYPYGFYVLEK